jgi:predicted ATPase/transcriptional regulator with XRE-family HTH domain
VEKVAGPAFGTLLRRHRLAAGLSQEDLAEQARMSADGIGSLERGNRRHPYRETVMLLGRALGLTPAAAAEFEAAAARPRRRRARVDPEAVAADGSDAATNLPSPHTSLVGREAEIADIVVALQKSRLVTVTGAGGVGKTRTALAVGAVNVGNMSAGVWFVELAPVAQGTFLPATLAQALNVQELPDCPLLETLLADLKQKSLLLLLDNCEHVIAEAAALADALLRGCPHLRILATSREPLRIAGEQTYRLPSLRVPPPAEIAGLNAAQAAEFPAVVLFAQRAQEIDRGFTLRDDNASIVAQICSRLDGIPLAIELAARRVNILPVRALSQNLDKRFRILTGGARTALPRHQTMRAVIDWSYELLDEDERALLRRVSVFVNGFKLEGAVAVAVDADLDDLDVFNVLASLIDKSLVVAELNGDALRYRLLESTRVYALEKLQAAGEHRASVSRHLRYLRDMFCEARLRVDGSGRSRNLDKLLAAELEDVRFSLDCIGESPALKLGAELLAAIDNRWTWIDLTREGAVRLERFIALTPAAERRLISRLWTAFARTVTQNGLAARAATSIAVGLAREAGDPDTLAHALTMHADALARPGAPRLDDALAVLAEAESLVPVGNLWLRLRIRRVRANAMHYLGELDDAAQAYGTLRETHLQLRNADEANRLALILAELEHERNQTEKAAALVQEVLPAFRAGRNRSMHSSALADLCGYLIALDRLSEARLILQEALATISEGGNEDVPEAIVHAALIVALNGDIRRAAQLAGYTDIIFRRADYFPWSAEESTRARLEALLHEQLAPDELRALRATGAALSVKGAIALVLASLDVSVAKSGRDTC